MTGSTKPGPTARLIPDFAAAQSGLRLLTGKGLQEALKPKSITSRVLPYGGVSSASVG